MMPCFIPRFLRFFIPTVLLSVLLSPQRLPAQMLDLNDNGMSDIWELIHEVNGLDPHSDADTDGDGLNDWEEYQLGLDPTNPSSNGQIDKNGQPLNDYAYVTGKLVSQNVLTISAIDATANQPDLGQTPINLGLLSVTRGGFPL